MSYQNNTNSSTNRSGSDTSSCSRINATTQRVSSAVNNALAGFFHAVGTSNGQRPVLTIVLAVVVVIVLGSGLADFTQESRAERLWVAQDTALQDAAADLRENFGRAPRQNSAIFKPKSGNSGNDNNEQVTNILEAERFSAMLDVAYEVEQITITLDSEQASRPDQLTFGLHDLCIQAGQSTCLITGILEAWEFNVTKAQQDPTPIMTLNSFYTKEELEKNLGLPVFDEDGNVTSAEAVRLVWLLEDKPVVIQGRNIDQAALDWELMFLDLMLQRNESKQALPRWEDGTWLDVLTIFPFSARTFSDEAGAAISDDVGILGGSYMLLIGYAIIVFSRWDRVLTGVTLAVAAVACVGGAIVASIGLAQYLDFLYGQSHSILPFLILGIGVDDSFVIYNAWRREEEHEIEQALKEKRKKAYEETDQRITDRMARTLSKSGTSVTVTSLTNTVAFGIGSTTVLPDLQSFCVYASLGIALLWLLQITAFSSAVVLNARRIRARRLDCLCCFKDNRRSSSSESSDSEPELKPVEPTRVRKMIRDVYGPVLMDDRVRVAVLISAVAVLAGLAYNISKFTVEATGENFIPLDSYARESLDASTQYYPNIGTNVLLVTEEAPEGQSYFDLMDDFKELSDKFTSSGIEDDPPFIDPASYDSWFDAFIAELDRRKDVGSAQLPPAPANWQVGSSDLDASTGFPKTEALFFQFLDSWLNDPIGFQGTPGAQYANDLVFNDDGSIRRTRQDAQHIPLGDIDSKGRFQEDARLAIRALNAMDNIVEENSLLAYAFSATYLNDWQTYKFIADELVQNISLALASVFVITMLLIGNPVASLLVFFMVVCTIVELMGIQPIIGLAIDTVSTVLFVLAIGLAVDYSAHIALDFMEKTGTRKERVIAALDDIGVAIFNGGFSTFLAVLLQSGSSSYVFRVVFYEFFGTVLFGLLNGLILLPVLLSYVGPDAFDSATAGEKPGASKSDSEKGAVEALSEEGGEEINKA